MPPYFPFVVVAALVGSALVTGVLFAFSLVVMRALQALPPAVGMATMQRINRWIVNPLFLALFLGTALLSLVIAVFAWRGLPDAGPAWWLAGALCYLFGPLGVTMAFNVPLNDRLAASSPEEAGAVWPAYLTRWLLWNHVRTALGTVGIAALALGLTAG